MIEPYLALKILEINGVQALIFKLWKVKPRKLRLAKSYKLVSSKARFPVSKEEILTFALT
jgi:hypothetical protein